MRNQFIKLFVLLFSFLWADNGIAKKKEVIRVSNALEFLKALGSDRTIRLKEGAVYNLTEGIDLLKKKKGITPPIGDPESGELKESVYYRSVYDGLELYLFDIQNLTIESEGEERAQIIVEPRYAYVMAMEQCRNITLKNIVLGHTDTGFCQGGVLSIYFSQEISIEGCDLYGCGTEGITAKNTKNLLFSNSDIRDCSYSIMTLAGCEKMHFVDSRFYRNREFTLVNTSHSKEILFKHCDFTDNVGTLFYLSPTHLVTLEDCVINHPKAQLGELEGVIDKNSFWSENSDSAKE